MNKLSGRRRASFIPTREHRRFVEFANTVRKYQYIGLCYGQAGVGKTLSARRYANWDVAEPLLTSWGPRDPSDKKIYAALARSRTLFFTPSVNGSLTEIKREFKWLSSRINACIEQHVNIKEKVFYGSQNQFERIELVIIDEAERLKHTALEHLRDLFDRHDIGLILIGMPGIEKRMSRYPQLYSRVGFAHQYHPLQSDEMTFVLQHHWKKLGLALDTDDFTDSQAIASIARITAGNFRLLDRLLIQVERILRINELCGISEDVVEAARETLIIGDN